MLFFALNSIYYIVGAHLRLVQINKHLLKKHGSLDIIFETHNPKLNINLVLQGGFPVLLGVNCEQALTQRDEVGAGLKQGRGQELELKHNANCEVLNKQVATADEAATSPLSIQMRQEYTFRSHVQTNHDLFWHSHTSLVPTFCRTSL